MEPLAQLFDDAAGDPLPLPPELAALYGPLRIPAHPRRPHVFTNFVASLDGVVSIDPPRGTGAEISGGDAHDRTVMGLLRAAADAVVIGAGNLRAEGDHVWTAERVCPELAASWARLRAALGNGAAPLQVVVTGSGDVDLDRAVFSSGAPALLVTTAVGAERLRARGARLPIAVAGSGAGWMSLASVLDAARLGGGARVLVESGPTSTTRFLAEGAVDELFLTRAPILVGRSAEVPTLALVEGQVFRPGKLAARLVSARRNGDWLFLRYALRGAAGA